LTTAYSPEIKFLGDMGTHFMFCHMTFTISQSSTFGLTIYSRYAEKENLPKSKLLAVYEPTAGAKFNAREK
jgi:hypothetical protein